MSKKKVGFSGYIPADPEEYIKKACNDGAAEARRAAYFRGGKTNPVIWGPNSDYSPAHHGSQLGAHIESEWTCPDQWGHDNYQRGHLPQLCIRASGWKAHLLAFILFWTMRKTGQNSI